MREAAAAIRALREEVKDYKENSSLFLRGLQHAESDLDRAEAERGAAVKALREYRTVLRQVYFLEHNEREWQSLEEAQEHARTECERIDAAARAVLKDETNKVSQ
jgi:hypothetical protein